MTLRWDYNLSSGRSLREVGWKREGATVAELEPSGPFVYKNFRPRFKINDNEKATLVILNVTRGDTGDYTCLVKDNEREESDPSTIRLDVQCKSKFTLIPDAFEEKKGYSLDQPDSFNRHRCLKSLLKELCSEIQTLFKLHFPELFHNYSD